MRKLQEQKVKGANRLWQMYRFVQRGRLFKNTLIIELTRYIPSLKLKRWVYIHLLNMTIGQHTAFAFKVMPDLLYPELITIGENCVIGYNTTILTHEFTVQAHRKGRVNIGDNTLIGANVIILPGIHIGSNVQVAAGTVVSKDVPDGALVKGNPMQIIKD